MVERVARAICAREFEDPRTYSGPKSIPEAVEEEWQRYIETACLVIAAVRDPTGAMVHAGAETGLADADIVTDMWRAMIEAALKE